jgi:hypothetical protein
MFCRTDLKELYSNQYPYQGTESKFISKYQGLFLQPYLQSSVFALNVNGRRGFYFPHFTLCVFDLFLY